MAMDELQVKYFFQDETSANYGVTELQTGAVIKSFQLYATTTAGTGVIAADAEVSNDGVVWNYLAALSIATVTTSGVGVIANVSNAFKYFRVNMYTITGTNCTAHANISYYS
jgi:hypothetical protein